MVIAREYDEGEANCVSLWQVGNHVIDVLSAGAQGQIINLPTIAVELAKQYKHVIVWADEREIADKAAKMIGASAMESPKSTEYPKGADANDMLQAGALHDWLIFAMGQIGIDVPSMPIKQPAPTVPTYGDMLLIKDAQPFAFAGDAKLPPIRWRTSKPPLPADMWVTGATSAAVWSAFQVLKQTYFCTWGRDSRGFSVTCDPVEFEVIAG